MKEIGGYMEAEHQYLPMLHESARRLNCGRNCLAYLVRAKNITKIALPYFLCGSVTDTCIKENVKIRHYHVGIDFALPDMVLKPDEWLYLVNYYGQFDNKELGSFVKKYKRVIIDNVQAYFQMPVKGADTLYSCRKFFGVSDGALLYTDEELKEQLPQDESFARMTFLFGRFERTASEFYSKYLENDRLFEKEPIKKMSKLTQNILCGIDYEQVKRRRYDNFIILDNALKNINRLKLIIPDGAFMYPLYLEKGREVRRELLKEKIYIPVLWPDMPGSPEAVGVEQAMAENILPLPVDQRYGEEEMGFMVHQIKNILKRL